ncbi:TonB-dependent receptor [Chitinophaga lutea]|uniref:TonB-dependent receptor n=1 Tax=Chitinophaga lutea TaxID=2488634 RepID=A0A3N4Q9U1_9BACT|nr:TonB-dependent receptor [Chitinophaga lutea]RPE12797.1 TonB-dependent receptor [Chitinophaga lutea]
MKKIQTYAETGRTCYALYFLALLLCTSFHSRARAQADTARILVAGTVLNESGVRLAGVSVTEKDGSARAVTDKEGVFQLRVPPRATLVLSYVGYTTREFPVAGNKIVIIDMASTADKLNEVVVVGFGRQKKISVTGAVTSISTREISKVSTPALSNAIAGKLPGIITRQSSGEPGYDAAQVVIRGLATFGNNAPLVLIDGVERNMNQINAQEVESFTILKDASATAVYGVRGANGVILINTRRGATGKPQVSFRTETASLQALRLPQYINAGEYAGLMNEALVHNGQQPRWSEEELEKYRSGSDPYLYPNSDWTNAVLKKNTWQTINNLSVTGGTDVIKYYTNVGFTLQDGLYKQDPAYEYSTNATIKRYNFRSNVDINLSKNLLMQLGLGGIIQNGNYPGFASGDIFSAMKVIAPIAYPIRNPDGTPGGSSTYVGWNPWARATQSGYTTQDNSTLQGTFGARWNLSSLVTEGLSVRGLFSYDRNASVSNVRHKAFLVKRYLGKDTDGNDLYSTPYREEQPLAYSAGSSSDRAIYMEAQVNYERTFGGHMLTGMFLYNQRDYVALTAGSSLTNLPYRRQGLAGRITYAYDNRYLAEVNMGYNGSENFPKGKRFGFFPAFSAGWIVSNEKFWGLDVVSNLKLRGSYGLVGNDQIGGARFLFLTTTLLNGQQYRFGLDQQTYRGMEENQIGNPDVTWEKARKANIGLDLGFLNDRITLQVDAFRENRRGILLQQKTVPSITGFYPWSIPYGNLGVVENKGIDALLEIKHTTESGLFYTFRGNYTYARNKVIEDATPTPPYAYLQTRGLRLGQIVSLVSDGLFKDQAEINHSPKQTFATPRPGDIKYRDINSDGVIDSYDRLPIGHPRLPEMTFGFGGTLAYKGFDLSIYFTGAANTSILITGTSMYAFADGLGVNNVMREYYDNRWTPGNRNAKYPAIDVGNNPNNYTTSDFWMRNGNYLRLRNAEIGYNMPERFNTRTGIRGLRFFVNAVNLYTWDHIKIMDPESNDGTGSYPLQRSLNAGLQIDFK